MQRRCFVLALLCLAQASLAGAVAAQAGARPRTRAALASAGSIQPQAAPLSVVLTGTVLDDGGAPAAGAVVVTSAGGQAVVGPDGAFTLALELPAEAQRVQVTALATAEGGNRVASRELEVAGSGSGVALPVGDLELEPGACEPGWVPRFGQTPKLFSNVSSTCVFDDGRGPALYAGGEFTVPFSARGGVARWNGTSWVEIGRADPSVPRDVTALAVVDDGSGPALYAGGEFGQMGGVTASRVARWDGRQWSAVGDGLNSRVRTLVSWDDGSGPALYAGGDFTLSGSVPVAHVARWDGTSWSALGTGPNNTVYVLGAFDLGAGPVLVAGGTFSSAGAAPAMRIATWDGASWSPLGGGLGQGGIGVVQALVQFDDGGGSALHAGGTFTMAEGQPANFVARWNGTSWSALPNGGGLVDEVNALAVFDDGSGPRLFAGLFLSGGSSVARWTPAGWSYLPLAPPFVTSALQVFDDGAGPALYAGGIFDGAGLTVTGPIARYDGSSWSALAKGLDGDVLALAVYDAGAGPALYAGGDFSTGGGLALPAIARWNGTTWEPLAAQALRQFQSVSALTVFDDGSGPALYAGGLSASSVPAERRHLARWRGSAWEGLGAGIGDPAPFENAVKAFAIFDDGSGPALFVGGTFSQAGGGVARGVARWDGGSWAPLGSGLANPDVHALLAFDDGSGQALYAGGTFQVAGGITSFYLARWSGGSWGRVGNGFSVDFGAVHALASFDAGTGPVLRVGGRRLRPSGTSTSYSLLTWDGANWMPDTTVVGEVQALAVHDDGRGPALFAGGDLQLAGGLAVNRLARWDGASWSALRSGASETVRVLASVQTEHGPALWAAGEFDRMYGSGDSYLAEWSGPLLLDFQHEDDFATALVNGQDVSSPQEFARLVAISGLGPNAGAAIFDSTPGGPNDPSQDRDLLVGRGNLLILQTDQNTTQTVPGVFDHPNDDSDGGTLRLDFAGTACLDSLVLVDIDAGSGEDTLVTQTDAAGGFRVHVVPADWTGDLLLGAPGQRRLDLTTLDPQPGWGSTATALQSAAFDPEHVVRLEVQLGSSGAIDDVVLTPTGVASGVGPGPHVRRR